MNVYTYSEARQNLAALLDKALREGEVRIKRGDGQVFVLRPQPRPGSPLDVEGVALNVTASEIVSFIHEGRRGHDTEVKVDQWVLPQALLHAGRASSREDARCRTSYLAVGERHALRQPPLAHYLPMSYRSAQRFLWYRWIDTSEMGAKQTTHPYGDSCQLLRVDGYSGIHPALRPGLA